MIETVFNDSFCTYIVKQDNYLVVTRNVIADAQCFCSFKHVSGCIVNKPYAKVKTTIFFSEIKKNFYFEELLNVQEYYRAHKRWNACQPDNGSDERIYFMQTQVAGFNLHDTYASYHKPSLIMIEIERV